MPAYSNLSPLSTPSTHVQLVSISSNSTPPVVFSHCMNSMCDAMPVLHIQRPNGSFRLCVFLFSFSSDEWHKTVCLPWCLGLAWCPRGLWFPHCTTVTHRATTEINHRHILHKNPSHVHLADLLPHCLPTVFLPFSLTPFHSPLVHCYPPPLLPSPFYSTSFMHFLPSLLFLHFPPVPFQHFPFPSLHQPLVPSFHFSPSNY